MKQIFESVRDMLKTSYITWIALAGSMSFPYRFIFCVVCNLALVASLDEMAAIWPTMGGQGTADSMLMASYHLFYMLCTEKWKKSMTPTGWLTVVNTACFFGAQFVTAAAIIASVILSTLSNNDASLAFVGFQNEMGWSDGISWTLGILYSIILPTASGQPISELILQATGSRVATTILTPMMAVCFINGTNGYVPVRTTMLAFIFNVLFGLLYLDHSVAFSAYAVSCNVFLDMPYVLPVIALLLRGRSVLAKYQTEQTYFALGRYGWLCKWVSAIFVVVILVFFCFPTSLAASGEKVSRRCAVVIGIVILVGAYWGRVRPYVRGTCT
ncbi:uncharacterized protein BCR38DRAFT_464140 [Pseudomassariella vexata]|uniref:Uncharacterized protein n=1 Tax=Pseudomassariella vexata TaxID=1141098 RepID=A0A1Y2EC26_9PEZI|nr:uncharacterized protein BCR38DRAFT_464140 [Pseudomassariella vexata]ORY68816.1 hypothetical protein BCR38DRAFT_464140 [Pseudomassariella vexata]